MSSQIFWSPNEDVLSWPKHFFSTLLLNMGSMKHRQAVRDFILLQPYNNDPPLSMLLHFLLSSHHFPFTVTVFSIGCYPDPSIAGNQGSITDSAVWLATERCGILSHFFSAFNHSDTSQSWESVSSCIITCGRGRIALSSERVMVLSLQYFTLNWMCLIQTITRPLDVNKKNSTVATNRQNIIVHT